MGDVVGVLKQHDRRAGPMRPLDPDVATDALTPIDGVGDDDDAPRIQGVEQVELSGTPTLRQR